MSRKKEPPRVLGPTPERGGRIWRVVVVIDGKRTSHVVPTEAEGRRLVRRLERELPTAQVWTVREAMERYLNDRVVAGHTLTSTAAGYRQRLVRFFGAEIDRDLVELTPTRAAALYQRAIQRELPEHGRQVSAATQRMELTIAKMLCNWAVRRGLLRQSPFAQVRPIGRPRRGKVQLRVDEARAFEAAALRRFTERKDKLSLAAVTALHMGLRASEALGLRVRDLDDEGRMLWVDGTKTERARRHLEVPASLQPFLRQAALSRAGDAFLFGESRNGGPRSRHVLHRLVKALCNEAGVTRVCPHSLRGLWATLQARAGADPNAIARSLGHGSFEITRRHYAQASALHGAQSERVTAILARPAAEPAPLSAEDVLKKLPAATIEELRTLLLQEPPQSIRNPPTDQKSGDFSTEIF